MIQKLLVNQYSGFRKQLIIVLYTIFNESFSCWSTIGRIIFVDPELGFQSENLVSWHHNCNHNGDYN